MVVRDGEMPTRQAQLRRRNLAMVALVAAFWPMPIGVGYLFLKYFGPFRRICTEWKNFPQQYTLKFFWR